MLSKSFGALGSYFTARVPSLPTSSWNINHQPKRHSWNTIGAHLNIPSPILSSCRGWNAIIITWRVKAVWCSYFPARLPSCRHSRDLCILKHEPMVQSWDTIGTHFSAIIIMLRKKKQSEAHTSKQDFQVAETESLKTNPRGNPMTIPVPINIPS